MVCEVEERVHRDQGVKVHEVDGLAHFVAVDLLKEVVSSLKQALQVVIVLRVVADASVDNTAGLDQAERVEGIL